MTKPKYLPLEGRSDLIRDTHTNAVLNVNTTALEQAKKSKAKRTGLQKRVESLESKMDEILKILKAKSS